HDVAIGQSVVKIAEGSAENQTESDLQQPVPGRTPDAVGNDNDSCKGGKHRKQKGFGGRTDGRKNSKGNSGVSNIRYVKKTVYYRDRLIEVESLLDEYFSPTVQNQRRGNEQQVRETPLQFK